MAGLPYALPHSNMNKLLHKCWHAVLEGGLQQVEQQLFVHPMVGQDGQDVVLHHGRLPPVVPKDLPQPWLEPGQQGLEEG